MSHEMKDEILAAIQILNKKMDDIQTQVERIPEIEDQVAKIPEIQKDIVELKVETQKDIRDISRSMAVIEHEHGDKLKALFDAFTVHTEKMEKQDKKVEFCEHKLENHDTEIYYLKNKVQGL